MDSSKHSQEDWASILPGATRGGADHQAACGPPSPEVSQLAQPTSRQLRGAG